MAQSVSSVVLEPAAQEVARMTANPPFMFQLSPDQGRARLAELQSGNTPRPEADIEDIVVPGGPSGQVPVRIVRPRGEGPPRRNGAGGGRLLDRVRAAAHEAMRPQGVGGMLPAVLYLHGGGWAYGDSHTHDRLIRELAVQSHSAIVFPEYSRSPEARYPTAIEECYAVAQWIATQGGDYGLDPSRMAVAGDSAGGNMATVLAMLANQRNGPRFAEQVLLYPATDATFETGSYREFADGYNLSREQMMWFWDQYLPDRAERSNPMASPLNAGIDQLKHLPPALIMTNEADVLRDEGEAYASKLRRAGVPVALVRYQGIIHDMAMLDSLAGTRSAQAATAQAALTLNRALHHP
ncbi:alpha/beta hydrolase [Plantactinospora sp. S1510]|uniref:Alpha/beta hydrolase n=1 Tax=Plantactinospora alkalitolerans TaxID=2789879 RepID=A0ABS0GMT2_9ACTN|nr:alpha/beta hydrolase [Plantactinospora alkalitolerans]MBF9127491.1 alpha/beta hydrolase [Plantactinospora alkalitolerans]